MIFLLHLKFSPSSLHRKCGVTFFQRSQYRKGWKEQLYNEETKMAFYLCGLLPKDTQPQSNPKINVKHIPSKGHSTKHLNSIPQNYQSHEKQEKFENLS